jgi:hypothetical protein
MNKEAGASVVSAKAPSEVTDAEIWRLKESILLRCEGFPDHTYPGRDEDLLTVRAFRGTHGDPPPAGFPGFRRLWWRISRLRGEG